MADEQLIEIIQIVATGRNFSPVSDQALPIWRLVYWCRSCQLTVARREIFLQLQIKVFTFNGSFISKWNFQLATTERNFSSVSSKALPFWWLVYCLAKVANLLQREEKYFTNIKTNSSDLMAALLLNEIIKLATTGGKLPLVLDPALQIW